MADLVEETITELKTILTEEVLKYVAEDAPLDKPLSQALMGNTGVPHERIILVYKRETRPEEKHA